MICKKCGGKTKVTNTDNTAHPGLTIRYIRCLSQDCNIRFRTTEMPNDNIDAILLAYSLLKDEIIVLLKGKKP